MVSIHTLTRRVTNLAKKVYEMLNSFNPHPHAEGDSKKGQEQKK